MRVPALVVRVGRGTMRAELARSGQVIWAAESTYATEEDLVNAMGALGAESKVARVRTIRIELERPLVQLRTLVGVPPVRKAALQALVAHQAGRFFRKNGKPLVTDAAWERSRRGAEKVATAAAIEEPWLEAIVEGVRAAGLNLTAISPARSGLLLLPAGERATRVSTMRRRVRTLATLAAGLWALVGILGLRRLARESRSVDRELASLAPAAAAARGVRQEYDAAAAMVATIEGARQQRGKVTARAAAILLALPDSAYLMTLHATDEGTGEMTGAARRALDVVSALERARAVEAPQLIGPIVRAPVGSRDYERFTVRFGRESVR